MTQSSKRMLAAAIAASLVVAAHGTAFARPGDQSANPVPAASGDYRLGAGDKLRIEVYKDTQLSQSVQVRPDGKITMPLIGDLDATGQTPTELRDTITGKLKEYVNKPSVTVIVVEATAATAFVMGEV